MRIDSELICRANGKVYERLIICELSSANSKLVSTPQTETREHPILPCRLYNISRTEARAVSAIAVYPILSVQNAALTIAEYSAAGELLDQGTHVVNFDSAKWRSRFNYRMHREECEAIRLIDEREPEYGDCSMHLLSAIDDQEQIILRLLITLPEKTPDKTAKAIKIVCLDSAGSSVTHSDIPMGSSSKQYYEPDGDVLTTSTVSVRIGKGLGDLHFFAWYESLPTTIAAVTITEREYCQQLDRSNAMLYGDALTDPRYEEWLRNNRPTPFELDRQRVTRFPTMPVFSIVVPLFNTPVPFFTDLLGSVRSQTYGIWELLLVNASPDNAELSSIALAATKDDKRVRLITLDSNEGISLNTNAGIAEAQGDFICFLDHDDLLEPDALFEYAKAINEQPDTDLLYCDEDKLVEGSRHIHPYFKPDFSIDLLRNNNYVCHFLSVRRTLLDLFPPNTSEFDGAQDHNLILNASEHARHIHHVSRILYHWRICETSTAGNAADKPYATIAGIKAVKAHLERLGIPANVESSSRPFTYQVTYDVPKDRPLVSILIPNKDHVDYLKNCIESIVEKTTYDNLEIIIIENNSTEPETFEYYEGLTSSSQPLTIRIVTWDQPFNFSAIINHGVKHASGDYLLLLNNDTSVITPNWIEILLGIASRKEVGMVGVKLLYPDDTIQHAGVCFDGQKAEHQFVNLPRRGAGYFCLADAPRDLSAVTAACAMTKRDVFEKTGGFDEAFAVAYNDVDYCLTLRKLGYLIVYTPEVELYHHESVTRGSDNLNIATRTRYIKELARLDSKWASFFANGDPYFNRNLSAHFPKRAYYHLH